MEKVISDASHIYGKKMVFMVQGNDLINDRLLSESSQRHRSADNLAARPGNTLRSVYTYMSIKILWSSREYKR